MNVRYFLSLLLLSNLCAGRSLAQGTDLFLQNLGQKLDKNPGLVVRLCNKRLEYEVSRAVDKKSVQVENKLGDHRPEFLDKLIGFCAGKALVKANQKARRKFKNTLVGFCSKVIQKNWAGYDRPFNRSLGYIYSDRSPITSTASNRIFDSIKLTTEAPGNFSEIYRGYLVGFIEQTIPYGNFESSKKLLEHLLSIKGISEIIKAELDSALARVLFFHSKFDDSKKSYELILKNKKGLTKSQSLIVRIEYAILLREMGLYDEAKKHMHSVESELKNKGRKIFLAWFFLEKAQLDFAINKNLKSANELLRQAEAFYKQANRNKNLFFVHIRRAEIQRKAGKLSEAKLELTRARKHLGSYQNRPLDLFEYYYQMALVQFMENNPGRLSRTIAEIEEVMTLTGEVSKYKSLVAPLLVSLTKDKGSVRKALLEKNKFRQNPLKSSEIDKSTESKAN